MYCCSLAELLNSGICTSLAPQWNIGHVSTLVSDHSVRVALAFLLCLTSCTAFPHHGKKSQINVTDNSLRCPSTDLNDLSVIVPPLNVILDISSLMASQASFQTNYLPYERWVTLLAPFEQRWLVLPSHGRFQPSQARPAFFCPPATTRFSPIIGNPTLKKADCFHFRALAIVIGAWKYCFNAAPRLNESQFQQREGCGHPIFLTTDST